MPFLLKNGPNSSKVEKGHILPLSNVAKTALPTELRSQQIMQDDLRFPFKQFLFQTFFDSCC